MALIKFDFYSHYLKRNVVCTAVLPVDKLAGDKRAPKRRGPYKTMYLLHGLFGKDDDWLEKTHVVETAEARDVCVIMPSGKDGFYLNKPEKDQWEGKFLSEELVDVTRLMFPLSRKREDTCLAGISIGAYSAVVNGLVRPDRFGKIVVLSGGFILKRALGAPEQAPVPHGRRSYYNRIFGDLDHLPGSEKDYDALARRFKDDPTLPKPDVYIACGEHDTLIEENRAYRDVLLDCGFNVTYHEPDIGEHEWPFWNAWIDCALDWYAPGPMKPSTAKVDYTGLTSKDEKPVKRR